MCVQSIMHVSQLHALSAVGVWPPTELCCDVTFTSFILCGWCVFEHSQMSSLPAAGQHPKHTSIPRRAFHRVASQGAFWKSQLPDLSLTPGMYRCVCMYWQRALHRRYRERERERARAGERGTALRHWDAVSRLSDTTIHSATDKHQTM